MSDLYTRRMGIRGEKRNIRVALEFMAKKASERDSDSYFYEMLLRPNVSEASEEDYGLTYAFDQKEEGETVRFVSSGGMVRGLLSVLPYPEVFEAIAGQSPDVEFYAEVYNYGGIQESSSYLETFYSPMGETALRYGMIQIAWDPYTDEEQHGDSPYFSEEEIASQYLELYGKQKNYFDNLLSEEAGEEEPSAENTLYHLCAYKEDYWQEKSVSGLKEPQAIQALENLPEGSLLKLQKEEPYILRLQSVFGDVGYLSCGDYAYGTLYELPEEMLREITVTATTVTPLSKRRKNAKSGVLRISLSFPEQWKRQAEAVAVRRKAERCCAETPFLQETVRSIYKQAGFTFDGGRWKDGKETDLKSIYSFSAEQRLQNFYDEIPCYHKETVRGYLEVIVCHGQALETSGYGGLMRITNDVNADESVLFGKYWMKPVSFAELQKEAEEMLAGFCKIYAAYRIYGAYGVIGEPEDSMRYVFSEKGEEVCRTADTAEMLKEGGTPLAVPEKAVDLPPDKQDRFLMINARGSIENYDQT